MKRRTSFAHRSVLAAIVGVAATGLLLVPATRADDGDARAESQPASAPARPDPARTDLDAGWALIRLADWRGAVKVLAAAERDAASDEIRAEALFALAHIWHHRPTGGDLDKAKGYYRSILAKYPRAKAAPWAMLTLARIVDTPEFEPKEAAELDKARSKAQEQYREVLATYPGHLVAHEAALRLAVTYLSQRGDLDAEQTGAKILIAYLPKHPDNYLAAQMNILAGEWQQRCGRDREAVDAFIAGYEAGLPGMYHQAKTCFRIAQIAEFRLNDDALAAHWYQRLVDEAREDNRFYMAKLGAARCRARLARVAEGVTP